MRWRDEGEGRQDSGGSRFLISDTIGPFLSLNKPATDDTQPKANLTQNFGSPVSIRLLLGLALVLTLLTLYVTPL